MSILSIVISVIGFGAVADGGITNNAPAINSAIEYCASQGGGVVTVPAGIYGAGSIFMRSKVTLQLEEGATLLGSNDIADYVPLSTTLDLSRYESGDGTVNHNSATDPEWSRAFIFCNDVENASIAGCGTIDGGDVRNPQGEEGMRGPHTILLSGCKNVSIRDINITRSANYAILGYELSDVRFDGLTIKGGWDGIHVRGGKHLRIEQCKLYTGDDAIAGGYWDYAEIRHCVLNSSCNGLRMIMPSKHVTVADCHIYGPGTFPHQTSGNSSSLAAINIEPGAWGKAPGRLDDLRLQRLNIEKVLTPLSVTLGDDNSLGTIRIEDIRARDITRMAMSVKSWGHARTDCVIIRRADMEFVGIDDPSLPEWFKTHGTNEWPVFPCWGAYFRNVNKVEARDLQLNIKGKDYRPATLTDNVGTATGL